MIVEVSVFPMLVDVVTVTSDASDVVGVARVCLVEGNNSSTDDGDVVTVTSDASDVVGVARVCLVEGNNSSTDDGKTSSKHTDTIEAHCHFEY